MTVRSLLVLLNVVILSASIDLAQTQAGDDLTTTSYPVGDLVFPISVHRQGEQLPTSENELMGHTRKMVAPATWEQAGGQGSMRYEREGYVLRVRQTAKVHTELKAFLGALLREQVSVEVRIASMTERTFEELAASGIQWTTKDGIESALLDDLKLRRFLESVQGDRRAQIMQMPKLTVFDGQEAKVSMGVWMAAVGVDFQEKDGKPVMTSKNDKVFLGTQARFLPTISKDRRHVCVQAEISQPEFILAVLAKVPKQRTVAVVAGTAFAEVRTETTRSPLSRIPYVNRLVRSGGCSRDSVKLIVLLTPRIVGAEETVETAEVQPLRIRFQAEDNGKFPLVHSHGEE
jgi:hypothetical protein